MRWTTEKVREFLRDNFNDEYVLLQDYEKYDVKLKLYHKPCEQVIYKYLQHMKQGSGCPHCRNLSSIRQSNIEEFAKYCSTIKDKQILEYPDRMHGTLRVRCLTCNSVYETTPTSFKRTKNHSCPKCRFNHLRGREWSEEMREKLSSSKMKSNKSFLQELLERRDGEYTALEPYRGCTEKILVRHNLCGYEWEVIPRNLLRRFWMS